MFRKLPNPVDFFIGLIVIGLAIVLFRDTPHVYSTERPSLDLATRYLPFYALASISRMVVAMIVSVIIALLAGYLAAVNRRWRKLILPAADILQSVPVLGFFPAAVFFFISLFNNSAFGVEAAAVFLIITSALWNMIFAVYESISTIPDDLQQAARQFGLRGYTQWTRLVLPAVLHKLAYNCVVSWANGWYFLIASEIIVSGPIRYRLPGLGSYLAQTMSTGDYRNAVSGLVTLALILIAFHFLVWSPLQHWSERFVFETGERDLPAPRPARIRFYVARSQVLRAFWSRAVKPAIRGIVGFVSFLLERERTRRFSILLWFIVVVFVGWVVVGVGRNIGHLNRPSAQLNEIPSAVIVSFLRLMAAYALALSWTLPLAVWVGRREELSRRVMPALEVIASIPATAFFPLFVEVILSLGGGMNVASILLVTTGMQWYLLFNLIAGVRAIPADLTEISDSLGLRGFGRWKRLVLPALYPSLITGSLTAIGGGWNALVLSEYVVANGEVHSVHGVGALLGRATYESGNLQLIVLSITAMVLFVLFINRFFWQPAYQLARRHFALNY